MGESLATKLLHSDLEVGCPQCAYPIWVQYAEIVAQAAVLCPCCRSRIWLCDAEGSVQNASNIIARQINQALKDLFQ